MGLWLLGIIAAIPLLLLYLYVRKNDQGLTRLSAEALAFSPTRYTEDLAHSAATQFAKQPVSVSEHLPPKTGRRYIIVGGVSCFSIFITHEHGEHECKAGFLGGWIVIHLLQRGEDPKVCMMPATSDGIISQFLVYKNSRYSPTDPTRSQVRKSSRS